MNLSFVQELIKIILLVSVKVKKMFPLFRNKAKVVPNFLELFAKISDMLHLGPWLMIVFRVATIYLLQES